MRRILGLLLFVLGIGGLTWWGWTDHARDIQADIERDAQIGVADARHPLELTVIGRDVLVSGVVDNVDSYNGLMQQLESIDGIGAVTPFIDILPTQDPYLTQGWLDPDGGISLSGFAPTEAERVTLGDIGESLGLASGASDRWLALAAAGQAALSHLHEGRWKLTGDTMTLTGVARSDAERSLAVEAINAVRGTQSQIAIAVIPLIDPFTTTGAKARNEPTRFYGFAPRLTDLSQIDGAGDLVRADGAPEDWMTRITAAAAALDLLLEGDFALTDETLILTGVARSREARTAVEEALDDLPEAAIEVSVVPFIEDYLTEASKNAEQLITFSGYAPSTFAQRILGGSSAALIIADGATDDWEMLAMAGQTALGVLHTGSWMIEGDKLEVHGVARSDAQRVEAMAAFGAIDAARISTNIAVIPLVAPYTFSAKIRGGAIIDLGGHMPTLSARDALGAEGAMLVIADGAPANWDEMVSSGLIGLNGLARGALTISGQHIHLDGVARSMAERDAAITAIGDGAGWLVTHAIDVRALILPFRTGGLKSAGGAPLLTGFVPAEYGGSLLNTGSLDIADGAPGNWEALAEAGAKALEALAYGGWQIEGDRLTISGIARDAQARAEAQAALVDVERWTHTDITLRALIDPFVTGVARDAEGALSYSGFAPPGAALPGQVEADGAPDIWFDVMREAQGALDALESGRFTLEGRKLRLTGIVTGDRAEQLVTERLAALEAVSVTTELSRPPAPAAVIGADKAPDAPRQGSADDAPALAADVSLDPPVREIPPSDLGLGSVADPRPAPDLAPPPPLDTVSGGQTVKDDVEVNDTDEVEPLDTADDQAEAQTLGSAGDTGPVQAERDSGDRAATDRDDQAPAIKRREAPTPDDAVDPDEAAMGLEDGEDDAGGSGDDGGAGTRSDEDAIEEGANDAG